MRRTAAVAVALALTLAACGAPSGTEPRTIDPSDVPYGLLDTGRTGAADGGAPAAGEISGEVGLVSGSGRIQIAVRAVPAGPVDAVAQALLDELTLGPTAAERAAGLRSAIPAGVGLRVVGVENGVAGVEVTGLEPGQTTDRIAAVGQVVLTLTSARDVRAVQFRNGEGVTDAPYPNGSLTDEPLARADYAGLLEAATPAP